MGQGPAHSYLHPTNVNGQDSGEKQHLKKEVRHQPHDSKETELLEPEHTRGTMTLRPSTLEKPSPPAGTSASAGQWQAGHSGEAYHCTWEWPRLGSARGSLPPHRRAAETPLTLIHTG